MLEYLHIVIIVVILLIGFAGIAFVYIMMDFSLEDVKNEVPKNFQFDIKVDEKILSKNIENEANMVLHEIVQEEEKKHLPIEPLINYTPCPIKYLIYDSNIFKTYHAKELYQKIVLKQQWLDEPFHTTLFEILLFLDNDQLFIKDENCKPIISTLRDEYNKLQKVKSYKVFSTLDIARDLFYNTLHATLKKFTHYNIERYVILAYLVKLINQSYHFQTLESYDAIELFLKTSNQKEQVKNILVLIEKNDSRFEFFKEAYTRTLKSIYSKPYVEENKNLPQLKLPAKLPKKILEHIEK